MTPLQDDTSGGITSLLDDTTKRHNYSGETSIQKMTPLAFTHHHYTEDDTSRRRYLYNTVRHLYKMASHIYGIIFTSAR